MTASIGLIQLRKYVSKSLTYLIDRLAADDISLASIFLIRREITKRNGNGSAREWHGPLADYRPIGIGRFEADVAVWQLRRCRHQVDIQIRGRLRHFL